MSDNIIAISDEKLDTLICNLSDYILSISTTFEKIEKMMDESSSFYVGESADEMMNKFQEIQFYFHIVKHNLTKHKEDYIKVKNNFIGFEESIKFGEVEQVKDM